MHGSDNPPNPSCGGEGVKRGYCECLHPAFCSVENHVHPLPSSEYAAKHTDGRGYISLPDHFKCRENSIESLIQMIYPNISRANLASEYFAEQIVLSCLNVDVDTLNQYVLLKFSGQVRKFTVQTTFPALNKVEKRIQC